MRIHTNVIFGRKRYAIFLILIMRMVHWQNFEVPFVKFFMEFIFLLLDSFNTYYMSPNTFVKVSYRKDAVVYNELLILWIFSLYVDSNMSCK